MMDSKCAGTIVHILMKIQAVGRSLKMSEPRTQAEMKGAGERAITKTTWHGSRSVPERYIRSRPPVPGRCSRSDKAGFQFWR